MATTDPEDLALEEHDRVLRRARQSQEDHAAWESATEEDRQAYADFLLSSPGRKGGARALGAAPPLGPAAYFAKRRISTAGAPPWAEFTRQRAISRPAEPPKPIDKAYGKRERSR